MTSPADDDPEDDMLKGCRCVGARTTSRSGVCRAKVGGWQRYDLISWVISV